MYSENMPSGLKVYTDFISDKEECDLLNNINKEKWDHSLPRRTQHYGYRYDYRSKSLDIASPIPEWIKPITDKMIEQKLIEKEPDQIIINEYTPGQGIHAHTDRIDIFGDIIVSLSLGSGCSFIFTKPYKEYAMYLLPHTLIIMEDDSRYKWRHEIPSRKTDYVNDQRIKRSIRISITFRYVKK